MSVKMPKPVSKTELSRLYTRLAIDTHHRLDNSTAEGKRALTSSTVSLMPVPIFMGR